MFERGSSGRENPRRQFWGRRADKLLGNVCHRRGPIVAIAFVASRLAAPAVRVLLKVEGQVPIAKSHRVSDVERIPAGMRVVAGSARASFCRPIHMQKMQVLIAVTETRAVRRLVVQEQV